MITGVDQRRASFLAGVTLSQVMLEERLAEWREEDEQRGRNEGKFITGLWSFDLTHRVLRYDAMRVKVTPQEFALLAALAMAAGLPLETKYLDAAIRRRPEKYVNGDEPYKLVHVVVCKIGKKLAAAGLPNPIENVYKSTEGREGSGGYRWIGSA